MIDIQAAKILTQVKAAIAAGDRATAERLQRERLGLLATRAPRKHEPRQMTWDCRAWDGRPQYGWR